MGKRGNDGDTKYTKKHKHKKVSKSRPAEVTPVQEELDARSGHSLVEEELDDEVVEVPAMNHEEEIVCDGEMELPQSIDESDCIDVDVEVADDDVEEIELDTTPSTPTPTPVKASTSKQSATKQNSSPASVSTPAIKSQSPANANAATLTTPSNAKKSKKRRDSGTSSDEERWLTAIESGKLEDVDDEMKKIKDPKLMTARQRAMYERNLDKDPAPGSELLMSLPTGYREKEKPQTAEDIQKAVLKSQKRKQLADEKREKDKKRTMDRLLKKQESKQRSTTRNKSVKVVQPMIRYRNTLEGAVIQLPVDHEFPLRKQTARAPPKVQLCGIAGCGQPKIYNCSKTNLPLCSFACYRKNVQAVRQIMC